MFKRIFLVLSLIAVVAGCSTDATVASRNLSKAAEMFEIERRIVFYNSWIGEYMLVVEGKCSVSESGGTFAVTCKTGGNEYKKHYLGLGGNVTYFSEQIDSANVSAYHYRVIFKPQSIVPNIDVETSIGK